MFSEVELLQLPSVGLPEKDRLPACAGIYVAVDSYDRVLYVGQATNLFERWKNHHRFEQLQRIHRKMPVRLLWFAYECEPKGLDEAENYFIDRYYPILNQTQVPAKQITPAEVALQTTLTKISKYVLIFGIAPAQGNELPIVCLKYLGWARETSLLRRIFQANNRKPTGLRWSETVRRKYGAWWNARCNGVALELGPWFSTNGSLRESATIQKLAGVEMLAIGESALAQEMLKTPSLKENYPGLKILEHDPIPLIWATLQNR
jgi:hypothetical protein